MPHFLRGEVSRLVVSYTLQEKLFHTTATLLKESTDIPKEMKKLSGNELAEACLVNDRTLTDVLREYTGLCNELKQLAQEELTPEKYQTIKFEQPVKLLRKLINQITSKLPEKAPVKVEESGPVQILPPDTEENTQCSPKKIRKSKRCKKGKSIMEKTEKSLKVTQSNSNRDLNIRSETKTTNSDSNKTTVIPVILKRISGFNLDAGKEPVEEVCKKRSRSTRLHSPTPCKKLATLNPQNTSSSVKAKAKVPLKKKQQRFSEPCKICDTTFYSLHSFHRHECLHDGSEFKCRICGKEFEGKLKAKRRSDHFTRTSLCSVALRRIHSQYFENNPSDDFDSINTTSADENIFTDIKVADTGRDEPKDKTYKVIDNSDEMKNMTTVKSRASKSNTLKQKSKRKLTDCNICGETFRSLHSYYHHQCMNDGDERVCRICTKPFSTNQPISKARSRHFQTNKSCYSELVKMHQQANIVPGANKAANQNHDSKEGELSASPSHYQCSPEASRIQGRDKLSSHVSQLSPVASPPNILETDDLNPQYVQKTDDPRASNIQNDDDHNSPYWGSDNSDFVIELDIVEDDDFESLGAGYGSDHDEVEENIGDLSTDSLMLV